MKKVALGLLNLLTGLLVLSITISNYFFVYPRLRQLYQDFNAPQPPTIFTLIPLLINLYLSILNFYYAYHLLLTRKNNNFNQLLTNGIYTLIATFLFSALLVAVSTYSMIFQIYNP